MKQQFLRLLAGLAVFLAAQSSFAVPVTFDFEGNLVDVFTIDSPDGAVGTFFSPGDTISGSFTFDSTTPQIFGAFYAMDALSFSVNGSYSGSAAGGYIQVSQLSAVDEHDLYAADTRLGHGLTAPDVGDNQLTQFTISLYGDFLESDDLLLTPPPVTPDDNWGANSDRIVLTYYDSSGARSGVLFRPTSIGLATAVPAPGTLVLMSLGLVGMGGVLGRRTRQPSAPTYE